MIEEEETWTCPQCTLDNKHSNNVCEACLYPEVVIDKDPLFGEQDWIEKPDGEGVESAELLPLSLEPEFVYGATPRDGGYQFRLWAPRAKGVSLAGEFSGWEDVPMTNSGKYFETFIPGVEAGQCYHYNMTHADGGVHRRNDPRSLFLVGEKKGRYKSITYDPNSYEWKHEGFEPPSRKGAILYEMHVASFGQSSAGNNDGTFLTCIPRLDHLVELGINVICLLPITKDKHTSCWGYARPS
jgi:1,4-alpha-glucan branching enzyme